MEKDLYQGKVFCGNRNTFFVPKTVAIIFRENSLNLCRISEVERRFVMIPDNNVLKLIQNCSPTEYSLLLVLVGGHFRNPTCTICGIRGFP